MWTLSSILWWRFCSQVNLGNWEKEGEKNGKQQTEGKKEGRRCRGGVEERRLRRREGKEKSEGENKFAPGFYLNLLIRSKACPRDMLLSFSGWALQWNSCVGGISTCDSYFMWEMNLPVMWETVGNEQAALCCDLTLKSGRIMAHKALEWEGQGQSAPPDVLVGKSLSMMERCRCCEGWLSLRSGARRCFPPWSANSCCWFVACVRGMMLA